MFWGLTPALDLLTEYETSVGPLPSELNVLIIGGVDGRHVLKTLARRRRTPEVKVNFYVAEACMENVAKQLLLINIALQSHEVLASAQKNKIFMELYGNSLVRPSVAKYLAATAPQLVKMVTDPGYLSQMMPFVDFEIKYKERDYLETVLKFWSGSDDFDICACWDRRLRKTLGVRYDSKVGAFDWDLHMRLHSIGAGQICGQEYRNFRSTGVAFSWLESEVSKPNRSMVCAVMPKGENFVHYGYLGDMVTGPFVAFGLECDDVKFLKSVNGQNAFRATDVTERNLSQIFHEIVTGEEYEHRSTSDVQMGSVVMVEPEKRVVDVRAIDRDGKRRVGKCAEIDGIRVKFISLSLVDSMKHKREYAQFFRIIYCGNSYLKHFNCELIEHIATCNALLLIENQKFVLSHRDKQLQEFGEQIQQVMQGVEATPVAFDVLKDNFAKYVKGSKSK